MADDSITRYLADENGDTDPVETAEWRDAFLALVQREGPARARYLLDQLAVLARGPAVGWSPELVTPYVNTIPVERQPVFPGDLAIEEKLASIMRWNALAMVVRANSAYGNSAGTSRATRARRTCSRSASIISSGRGTSSRAATSCSSSRTARPASMPAPSWKAA